MVSPPGAVADEAIAAGIDRLAELAPDGQWRGFPTLAGESRVWVSGFVLAHLAPLAPRRAAVVAGRRRLAEARRPGSGWRYDSHVPPDADSTAWCLLALSGGRALPARDRREAEAFLAGHLADGGARTFLPDSGIADFIEAGDRSVAGWTAPHDDVSAACALAGVPRPGSQDAESLLGLLVSRQTGAGWFDSYWWRGPHYATAVLLRALARHGRRLDAGAARRLLRALRREQLADGGYAVGAAPDLDPFTTALALDSLNHLAEVGGARARRRAASALVRAQRRDGGWAGGMPMRIPAPDVLDPHHVDSWLHGGRGGNSYVPDRDGVFATAMSVHALAGWLAVETGERAGAELEPVEPRPAPEEAVLVRAG
jgi:hypothetical protein